MTTRTSNLRVVPAQRVVEGGGFVVHRPFPVAGLSYVDPFLLIDEMGPIDYGPGEAIGAPDHPHRGFETVTYMIDGAMQHEDSHGHRGSIRSGDVQWMTAGSGVIHSEMPADDLLARGGRMHGFQIWVNLPSRLKLSTPRYQEYSNAQLPAIEAGGAWIRVIAGSVDGHRSPIETTSPTTMLHVKLAPHASKAFGVPTDSNAIVHTIAGSGTVDDARVGAHEAGLITSTRGDVRLEAGDDGMELLLLAGMPLGEPVARYGPFVMNTEAELRTAFSDFQNGRFGEIARNG